jgi:hypothetical protein
VSVLRDEQKRRYARQITLAEIGVEGQAQLCAAELALDAGADPRAAEVARTYLARSGVQLREQAVQVAPVATTASVRALAGDPELDACAAWLAGSFAAVEAIKAVMGLGAAAQLDATALSAEPD